MTAGRNIASLERRGRMKDFLTVGRKMKWKKLSKIGLSARDTISGIFWILCAISMLFFGSWGLIITIEIISKIISGSLFTIIIGIAVSILMLPLVFAAAPWYASIAWGDWFPVTIIYGGALIVWILFGIGRIISSNRHED